MTPLETTALTLSAAAVLLTYVVAYMVFRWWLGRGRRESIKFAAFWPIMFFAIAAYAGEVVYETDQEQTRLSDFE